MSEVRIQQVTPNLSTQKPRKSFLNKIGFGFLYLLLGTFAIIQIYPLVWLVFFSLKTNKEVFGMSPFSLPQSPQWENYTKAWKRK